MTLILVGLALLVGLMVGISAFAVSLALLTKSAKEDQLRALKAELSSERSLRLWCQTEADGLRAASEMQKNAIEGNSLPWVVKNDMLESRYESEAIDKMDRPGFYSDVVDGLGR